MTHDSPTCSIDVTFNISLKCAQAIKDSWTGNEDVNGPDHEEGHRIWQTYHSYAKLYLYEKHWYLRYDGPLSEIHSIPNIDIVTMAEEQTDPIVSLHESIQKALPCAIHVTFKTDKITGSQLFDIKLTKLKLTYNSDVEDLL